MPFTETAAGANALKVSAITGSSILYGTAVLLEKVGEVIKEGGVGVAISSQSDWRMPALTPKRMSFWQLRPRRNCWHCRCCSGIVYCRCSLLSLILHIITSKIFCAIDINSAANPTRYFAATRLFLQAHTRLRISPSPQSAPWQRS